MKNQPIKIGFIHNLYPVLSQTFISKEMLGLQDLGLPLKIYALFYPLDGQEDETYPRKQDVDYLIPKLSARRLLKSHVYFCVTRPLRYLDTFFCALRRRQNKTFFATLLWTLLTKKETSKEQRQDLLLHFLLAAPLAKKMLDDNITFINSHFADAAAGFALLTAKLTGLKYGVTTHAYDIFTPQFNLFEKLNNARFVLTCTRYNKTVLLEHEANLNPESVHVFYHGINITKFERQHRPDNEVTEIFSVGRLVPKKGFDVLLEACAHLRDVGYKFKCRIVGDGPLYDDLKQLVNETRLHDEVDLVGSLPSNEIKAYYERADIFVLPCLIEEDGNRDGIPNVIAEAMAMQLPVISSHISGIPELVIDGDTGFLTEQRDVDAVAEKLEHLLRDKSLREKMGIAGRNRVQAVFDSNVCLQNLYDFYIKELATR